MRQRVCAVLLVTLLTLAVRAVHSREIRGRVVDEAGHPAAGVDVCYYWNANGPFWGKDGKQIDLESDSARNEYFGPRRLGQMEPGAPDAVKTDTDGRFVLTKIDDAFHTLMAMDADRHRGGLGVVSKADPSAPVEICLAPLVRVRGTLEGPDKGVRPAWTNVYIETPRDLTRPLDITRLANCASNEARLLISLPPGRYRIDAYNGEFDGRLSRDLVLTADVPEVDLGVMALPRWNSVMAMSKASQAKKTFGDYTKRYGRTPPAWHVADARGVSRQVQLSDFKGKWVVVDFWTLSCVPCLKVKIPELMKFYENHAHQHDRFEIISFCLDPDGELQSLADMDRALEPIVTHVWGGRNMPFPVLLDNTFRTWESFGLKAVTMILVDPNGNLVPGTLKDLEKKLAD